MQKDYDLLQAVPRTKFLQEIFNLRAKMEEMVLNLDGAKLHCLREIDSAARDLPSLTSRQTTTKKSHTQYSVSEDAHDHGTDTVFAADSEIVEHVNSMGHRLDMVPGVRGSEIQVLFDFSLDHLSSSTWR